MKGWLAEQVRLWLRGRGKWPIQMGQEPANETEQRLVTLWEDSIKKRAPKVPSALDSYTTWWSMHEQQYLSAHYKRVGQKVKRDGKRLWQELQAISPTSRQANQLREYVNNGEEWPSFFTAHAPSSQLERDVLKDWYGEKRDLLSNEWTPWINEYHRQEANALWHGVTHHIEGARPIARQPSRRNQQRRRQRQKERRAIAD